MRKWTKTILRFYKKQTYYRLTMTLIFLYVFGPLIKEIIYPLGGIGTVFFMAAVSYTLYRTLKFLILRKGNALNATMEEIDKLTGVEFEGFLKKLFQSKGYRVDLTKTSGDYGADLILHYKKQKIAVQAKRYAGSVGVEAVQQVLAAMKYYQCNHAMVITNSRFTPNATELARKTNVELLDREKLRKELKGFQVEEVTELS
jgi:restriction system protein